MAAGRRSKLRKRFRHTPVLSAGCRGLLRQTTSSRGDTPMAARRHYSGYCHARAARQLFLAYAAYGHHLPIIADNCSATPQRPPGTREEIIMNGISKTLNEMTIVERTSLLDTVGDALEATAEEAEGAGDSLFAANSTSVANTIRGPSGPGHPRLSGRRASARAGHHARPPVFQSEGIRDAPLVLRSGCQVQSSPA